jgi:hypothetical protein
MSAAPHSHSLCDTLRSPRSSESTHTQQGRDDVIAHSVEGIGGLGGIHE